jgi:hypothetical protein
MVRVIIVVGAEFIATAFEITDFGLNVVEGSGGGDFGIAGGYTGFFVFGEFLFAFGAAVLVYWVG